MDITMKELELSITENGIDYMLIVDYYPELELPNNEKIIMANISA